MLYGIDEKYKVPLMRNAVSDSDVKQQVKKQEKGCEEEEEEDLTNIVIRLLGCILPSFTCIDVI